MDMHSDKKLHIYPTKPPHVRHTTVEPHQTQSGRLCSTMHTTLPYAAGQQSELAIRPIDDVNVLCSAVWGRNTIPVRWPATIPRRDHRYSPRWKLIFSRSRLIVHASDILRETSRKPPATAPSPYQRMTCAMPINIPPYKHTRADRTPIYIVPNTHDHRDEHSATTHDHSQPSLQARALWACKQHPNPHPRNPAPSTSVAQSPNRSRKFFYLPVIFNL